MSNFAMAVVDGTGPYSDRAYTKAMKHSFCSQLGRALGASARYERGPSAEGYRIRERSARAVEYLTAAASERIMLAGYSRGGSIAVIGAQMLQKLGKEVHYLFLFDPVDRHLSGDSETIPANVRNVWVARRRIGAEEMDQYDHTIAFYKGGHNPVRNWFGTTATKTESDQTIVRSEVFLGSHGALGGVGWPNVAQDPQCQLAVAKFMNGGLVEAGIPVRMASVPPEDIS